MLRKLKSLVIALFTAIRIRWIKYWDLQRKFVFESSPVSFRKALTYFISLVLFLYFVVGLPILGYDVYVKKTEGVPLAIASALYPFPVATVGNDVILLKPYSDRLHYLKFFAKQTQQPLPNDNDLRTQVIDKLIDESVIRQWAEKEGITVTNADIEAAYDQIVKQRGSETNVKAVLSQLYNLNDAEFKRLIPDLLYREKIDKQLLEQVHIKHILITNEATAQKVRSQVTPQNFDALAKQYSEDKTSRDTGGDLGFFDRERAAKLDPSLAAAFFATPPGQISQPVKSQYGFDIIYVVEKTGREPLTFDQWLDEKRKATKIRKFLK